MYLKHRFSLTYTVLNISKVYVIRKKIPELHLFHYGILEILDKSVYLPLKI